MRIVAGQARGRRLLAPPGRATRPTADRVREAIFSMVSARLELEGVRVLDLYAGSGALGLEALSRGASHCTFIEREASCAEVIAKNAAALGLGARAALLTTTVEAGLPRLGAEPQRFALVLTDPPYRDDPWPPLAALVALGLLDPAALIVVEHDLRRELPASAGGLRRLLTRGYGKTGVSLLALEALAPEEST
ncbi:MAG: 16S rRNA (guanine(966)-N(2))-methyltransferase RsmD [Proteobacteria bacterium]|nr:16S rRNA (guanine(966)-N(2))-methyltransferase RsmD [Pseudomonadota bacterium]